MPTVHDPFGELLDHANGTTTATPAEELQELDALIVGAGFAGTYQLKILRDAGFSAKLVEAGSNYGGVWYWNRYPGARVDIEVPYYQFSSPEIWNGFEWQEKFPGSRKIREYFDHVANVWDLRRDTEFNTFVNSAVWNEEAKRWIVKTRDGKVFRVRWLLANTGFAAKRHFPDWKGIEKFKGGFFHPSYWPHEEPDLAGKRIAVIGTGATAVQIIQALTPIASQLTVFQRTPNTAMPLKQEPYKVPKSDLPDIFAKRSTSYWGIDYSLLPRKTFDDTPEQRKETYEHLWALGNLKYWIASYEDMLFDDKANTACYEFWRDKTRPRIKDAKLRDLLAPMEKPYAFGCKRIPLEQRYFECFNEEHVELVDLKSTPVQEVTEAGIKIKNEAGEDRELQFDYIISATGFDSYTGGLLQMNLVGENGTKLSEYWKDGVKTTLGISIPSFPNMFFQYGPQAPTALCNGPTCAEFSGNWIRSVMEDLRNKGVVKIVGTDKSAKQWTELVDGIADTSLLPTTKSWYRGHNIPGKRIQTLNWLGGVPDYFKRLDECLKGGYKEFELR